MQYFEITGSYADAWDDVMKNGGQLYPGNGRNSASVVVRGKNCFTYWPADSKRRQEVRELAEILDMEAYGATGGRIARQVIDSYLLLPYRDTFWSKTYRRLAMKGQHWHYCHVTPWQKFYGVEVDVKSAYMSSLLSAKSLLYQEGKGYLDDGGAIDNLRNLMSVIPKWFRLQLLGVIASWRFSFLCKDKKNPSNTNLVQKYCSKITYGSAFNCVHRAILRIYKIMERIHTIGGEYIKRMHTDSFFLDISCPVEVERDIFDYLDSKGLKTDIKATGEAFFFDLNCGFIGKKFVGSKLDTVERMRANGIKMRATNSPSQVIDRFGLLIENSTFLDSEKSDTGTAQETYEQIALLDFQ